MQRVGTALLFLLMVTTAWAQSTIPGTFTSQSAQPTAVVAGPILTPPIVSFGSGLSAPTVINGQSAIVVGAPQGATTEYPASNAGYVSGSNGFVPMPTTPVVPVAYAGSQQSLSPSRPARFDFIVAQSDGHLGSRGIAAGQVGDTSLGQMAASLRKGPPPTQRKFTNDDIARISGANNQMPGASTPQPTYPQQQAQPQPQPHSSIGTAPPGAKPSPFSPRPVDRTPSSSTTAASDPN